MKWEDEPGSELERVHDEEFPWIRLLIVAGLCLYFGALLGVWVGAQMIQRGEFP